MTEDANDQTGNSDLNIPDDLAAELASDKQRSRADELFDVFSHRRRRLVLYYLKTNDQTSLDKLATQIAEIEAEIDKKEVSERQQKTIKADLCHLHLPKLADLKVVEYDHRSGDARYRDPPKVVKQLLQTSSLVDFE